MKRIMLLLSLLTVLPAIYSATSSGSSSSSSSSSPRMWSSKEVAEFLDNSTSATAGAKKAIVEGLGSQSTSLIISPDKSRIAALKYEDTGTRVYAYSLLDGSLQGQQRVKPSSDRIEWVQEEKGLMIYVYIGKELTARLLSDMGNLIVLYNSLYQPSR